MNAFAKFVTALGFIDPYHLIEDEPDVAEVRVSRSNVSELIKQWGDGAEVAGFSLEYMGKQPATIYTEEYMAVYRIKRGDQVLGYMELLRVPRSQAWKPYVLIKLVTNKYAETRRRTLITDYKRELREAKRMLAKRNATLPVRHVVGGKVVAPQVYHDHWHGGLVALQSQAYPEFFNY